MSIPTDTPTPRMVPAVSPRAPLSQAPSNPFLRRSNPNFNIARAASRDFMARHDLYSSEAVRRRVELTAIAELVADAWPAADPAALALASDWCHFLGAWDDLCDFTPLGRSRWALEGAKRRCLAVLRGARVRSVDLPVTRALGELGERLRGAREAGPWFERLAGTLEATFDACIWEAGNRHDGAVPHVKQYLEKRLHTGGVYTVFALAPVISNVDLPDTVLNDPVVVALERAANRVICWSNDWFSSEREAVAGDVHNLVLLFRHHGFLDFPEARALVARMHDAEVAQFLRLEVGLPSFRGDIDAQVDRYCAMLRSWMAANHHWSAHTSRYALEDPTPSERPLRVASAG